MNCPPVPVCIRTVGASRLTATWCQWLGNADKQPFYDISVYVVPFLCHFQISIGLVSSRCSRSKLSIYSLENEPLLDRFDLGSDAQQMVPWDTLRLRKSQEGFEMFRRIWRFCCVLVSIFKRWTMQAWGEGRAAGVVTNTGHVDVSYTSYNLYKSVHSLRMETMLSCRISEPGCERKTTS